MAVSVVTVYNYVESVDRYGSTGVKVLLEVACGLGPPKKSPLQASACGCATLPAMDDMKPQRSDMRVYENIILTA